MHCLIAIFVLMATATVAQSRRWFAPEVSCWITQEKVPASYEDAQRYCEIDGAVLASPLNPQLFNYMQSLINVHNHSAAYFIGTRANRLDDGQKVQYVSVEGRRLDDMPRAVFDAIDQLDLEQGDCLSMDRHEIRAVPCSDHLPYICYSKETPECGLALVTTPASTTVSTPTTTASTPTTTTSTQTSTASTPTTTASTPTTTASTPTTTASTPITTTSRPPRTIMIPSALVTTQVSTTVSTPTTTASTQTSTASTPTTTASTPTTTASTPTTTASTPTTTTSRPPRTIMIPPGYTYYAASGSYYKHHARYMSWDAASTTCASEGAHMVVLNDAKEADIVSRIVIDAVGYTYATWTGLRDNRPGAVMEWRTIHGEPLSDVFHEWGDGRPANNAGYTCAVFSAYTQRLYDWSCDSSWYFTCEISR